MQKKSFQCLEKNSSVFSLKRDHNYYYQPNNKSGGDYLGFVSLTGCSKGQINLYEGLCHDVVHDDIEGQARCSACKESQDESGQSMLSLFRTTKWTRLWRYIHKWPQYHIQKTYGKCPALMKCLKSDSMDQFPLLFSFVIKISVKLVQVVSLEIFVLSQVSHMK